MSWFEEITQYANLSFSQSLPKRYPLKEYFHPAETLDFNHQMTAANCKIILSGHLSSFSFYYPTVGEG